MQNAEGPFAKLHRDVVGALLFFVLREMGRRSFKTIASLSATCRRYREATRYFVQKFLTKNWLEATFENGLSRSLFSRYSLQRLRLLEKMLHAYGNENAQNITQKTRTYIVENFTFQPYTTAPYIRLRQRDHYDLTSPIVASGGVQAKISKRYFNYEPAYFADKEALFLYIFENFFLEKETMGSNAPALLESVLSVNKGKHALTAISSLIQTLSNELSGLNNNSLPSVFKILRVIVEAKVFDRNSEQLQTIKKAFLKGLLKIHTTEMTMKQLVEGCYALVSNGYIDASNRDEANRFFHALIFNINCREYIIAHNTNLYIINGFVNCMVDNNVRSFVLSDTNFKNLLKKYDEYNELNVGPRDQSFVEQMQVAFLHCITLLWQQGAFTAMLYRGGR